MTNFAASAGVSDVQSRFVSVGANRIHYVTTGKGNCAIVFVHGWASHLGFWREQVSFLADKARLLLVDLPGHGQSDKPQTAYTLDFFATAMQAALADAGVERAVFIGHSMGAAALCRLYQQAPDKFAALVSVDGLMRRPLGTPAEARALVGPFATSQYLDQARTLINSFFPIPGTERLRDQVMSEMLATPQHIMLGGMLAMFGPDQPDWLLHQVKVPVLVINVRSPWWNEDYEAYVRSLSPQSDYVLMENVGHFPMLEQPAAFNSTLLAMLQKFDLIAK